MPKKPKAAAAALSITDDCDLNGKGFGALPFVQHTNFITNQEALSAAKKHLLSAGYESLDLGLMEWLKVVSDPLRSETLERWNEEDCVLGWDPRGDNLQGDSWTLVAMVMLREDGLSVHDAVALYARPAGMVDHAGIADQVARDIAGFTEQSDPQPAPAMTKSEAHLGRKSAQFEILQPTDALLRTFTPRVEKHGEDDVSAASLGLSIEAPNTILDLLSPSLRRTLYAAPEGQVTLPGVEESTPLLRTKVIETLKLTNCYEGWLLKISHGFEETIDISGCRVDKFVVTPRDGGSVQLDLRIGSSDISEEEAGWLYGKLRHDIEITLHAPQPKPEAIDGSTEAFERDHPTEQPSAEDLFAQEHGHSDDGADEQRQQDEAIGEEA